MGLCLGCLSCQLGQEAGDGSQTLRIRIGKGMAFLFNRLGKHGRLGTQRHPSPGINAESRSGREDCSVSLGKGQLSYFPTLFPVPFPQCLGQQPGTAGL